MLSVKSSGSTWSSKGRLMVVLERFSHIVFYAKACVDRGMSHQHLVPSVVPAQGVSGPARVICAIGDVFFLSLTLRCDGVGHNTNLHCVFRMKITTWENET